jgi:hypothetical protein
MRDLIRNRSSPTTTKHMPKILKASGYMPKDYPP